jgi:hypothetical protein
MCLLRMYSSAWQVGFIICLVYRFSDVYRRRVNIVKQIVLLWLRRKHLKTFYISYL